MKYQPIIGLEIHIELKTQTKMFCSCLNDPDEKHRNTYICPTCTAQPGSLPVINKEAVKKVIKTGLALNCQIPEYSKFDRKNYFYPDLPKGYQISQLYQPLCKEGFLEINGSPEGPRPQSGGGAYGVKKIRIREIHLEEDTGRLAHPEGADYSLVDFNRAGIPLMELVTEPDLKSAQEAREFAMELQLILRYLGVSEADMEKGQLRVEANISLIKANKNSRIFANKISLDSRVLGTKVEIKNLNSFRAVRLAIEYEIERQRNVLEGGKKVVQETRGWSDIKGETISQREKEEAHDYRYFPEPDLPLLRLGTQDFIGDIRAEIPELPRERRERFKREYRLLDQEIEIFVQRKKLGEYFEKVVSEFEPRISQEDILNLIKLTSNYLITDLQGLLKGAEVSGEDFLITAENFAEFITLIHEEKISSKIAKTVLEEMFKTGSDPSHIIEEKDLQQLSDTVELEKIVTDVVKSNPKAVEDYKKGKETALQFFIGQIMAKTGGKANPKIIGNILRKNLEKA